MSNQKPAAPASNDRSPFGRMQMGGAPPQKSKNFSASGRRLVGRLAPERKGVIAVILLAVGSVALQSSGPLLLARATNMIFSGYMGSRLAPGITKAAAMAQLRAS